MLEEILLDLKRSTSGNSYRYVKFRFRNKKDLIEFADLIKRPELKTMDKIRKTYNLIWDNEERIDLGEFLE